MCAPLAHINPSRGGTPKSIIFAIFSFLIFIVAIQIDSNHRIQISFSKIYNVFFRYILQSLPEIYVHYSNVFHEQWNNDSINFAGLFPTRSYFAVCRTGAVSQSLQSIISSSHEVRKINIVRTFLQQLMSCKPWNTVQNKIRLAMNTASQ